MGNGRTATISPWMESAPISASLATFRWCSPLEERCLHSPLRAGQTAWCRWMRCRSFVSRLLLSLQSSGVPPGGQISISTRSGTNDFHGTLFEYFRNDVLDAKDWFANLNHLAKPEERQNDFGGVFGGPIFKDRTFFFFSYEGLRLRQPSTQQTAVPDAAARQQAPASILPYLNAYPVANGIGLGAGLSQFNAGYSNPSTLDAYSI